MNYFKKICLAVLVFIAAGHILSAANLGLSGWHPGRQTTVYGHILGFTEVKDFAAYDTVAAGEKRVYDIPIYQYLIGKAAQVTQKDPLVTTRYANTLLWLLTAFAGYRLCRSLGGAATSGLLYICCLAISPLVLHWYSVPFPDIMSIAFSLTGLLLFHRFNDGWKGFLYGLPFLGTATLIKSPVVFVFIVFYSVYKAICALHAPVGCRVWIAKIPLFTLLALLLFGAIFAEYLRGYLIGRESSGLFAQSPAWYFGTWELRSSAGFWETMWQRTRLWGLDGAFGYGYLSAAALALMLNRSRRLLAVITASTVALFAGWLVFANVYWVHDYYQLPAAVIAFIAFAISLSHIISRLADVTPPPPSHTSYGRAAYIQPLVCPS